MRTYQLAYRDRWARVDRLASCVYRVTGCVDGAEFARTYAGRWAEADAFCAANRSTFHGELPRPMVVRSGDTLQGMQAVEVGRP